MIIDGKLSLSQRELGCRLYKFFSLANGVSYSCVSENMIMLFALKSGYSAQSVALIATFPYLGMIFMLAGKGMIQKFGCGRTICSTWLMRNIAAMLTALAPLVSYYVAPWLGLALMMLGSFSFFACRSAGVVAMQPLIGEISTGSGRGKFVAGIYRNFNVASILALGLIALMMLAFSKSVTGYQIAIVFGSVVGLLSASVITRIPESRIPMESAARPLMDSVRLIWREQSYRKQLFANCAALSGIMLVAPISLLMLKEGYGISESSALFFVIVQLGGGIASSYLGAFLLEEIGPRPLVILNFAALVLVSGLCAFAPHEFQWFYMFSIFGIVGACSLGLNLSLLHYFMISIPNKERVGLTLFMQIVSGLLAGLVGVLLGSGMLSVLHRFGFSSELNLYRAYFAIVSLLLLPLLLLIFRLERLRDWHLSKVLGLAFSPRDIITLYYMNSFEQLSSPHRELENIEKLEDTGSELSEKMLLSYLDSPKFALRARSLQSLGKIPFSDNVAKALIRELAHGEHSTAYMAADLLGKNKVQEAVPLLVKALDSSDYYLQGKCMIALAELQAGVAYDRIREIFVRSDNPRTIIHGSVALVRIGHLHDFRLLLQKTLEVPAGRIREELLCSLAELGGLGDSFYKFLKLFKENPEEAASYLIDELAKDDATPLPQGLKDSACSSADCKRLVALVLDLSAKGHGHFSREVDGFLQTHDAEKLCPEFLYCLMAICIKDTVQEAS